MFALSLSVQNPRGRPVEIRHRDLVQESPKLVGGYRSSALLAVKHHENLIFFPLRIDALRYQGPRLAIFGVRIADGPDDLAAPLEFEHRFVAGHPASDVGVIQISRAPASRIWMLLTIADEGCRSMGLLSIRRNNVSFGGFSITFHRDRNYRTLGGFGGLGLFNVDRPFPARYVCPLGWQYGGQCQ